MLTSSHDHTQADKFIFFLGSDSSDELSNLALCRPNWDLLNPHREYIKTRSVLLAKLVPFR
jgi:hypothetical protein